MTTFAIFSAMMFMGLTCSLGCGTIATPFVLGSLLGEGQDIKESRRAIMIFSLGKVVTYTIFGVLASIFGAWVLGMVENLYPNATSWLVRAVTFYLGIRIILSTFSKKSLPKGEASSCGACPSQSACPSSGGGCSSSEQAKNSKNLVHKGSFFLAGALMASIPCGPLLTALTYASTMNPILGTFLLFCFGVANSIFPVLFYASLVGLANREFHRDAPTLVKHTKHVGGAILMYSAIFMV